MVFISASGLGKSGEWDSEKREKRMAFGERLEREEKKENQSGGWWWFSQGGFLGCF